MDRFLQLEERTPEELREVMSDEQLKVFLCIVQLMTQKKEVGKEVVHSKRS